MNSRLQDQVKSPSFMRVSSVFPLEKRSLNENETALFDSLSLTDHLCTINQMQDFEGSCSKKACLEFVNFFFRVLAKQWLAPSRIIFKLVLPEFSTPLKLGGRKVGRKDMPWPQCIAGLVFLKRSLVPGERETVGQKRLHTNRSYSLPQSIEDIPALIHSNVWTRRVVSCFCYNGEQEVGASNCHTQRKLTSYSPQRSRQQLSLVRLNSKSENGWITSLDVS